jgi:hypothetical protein
VVRYVFRGLVAATLLVMYVSSKTGGRMGPYSSLLFFDWFIASLVVFAAFGVYSAVKLFRDPTNRRAYLLDILIAVSWIPYWIAIIRTR